MPAHRTAWQAQLAEAKPALSPWKVPLAAQAQCRSGMASIQLSSWDPWGRREAGSQLPAHKPGVCPYHLCLGSPDQAPILRAYHCLLVSTSGMQCRIEKRVMGLTGLAVLDSK